MLPGLQAFSISVTGSTALSCTCHLLTLLICVRLGSVLEDFSFNGEVQYFEADSVFLRCRRLGTSRCPQSLAGWVVDWASVHTAVLGNPFESFSRP